MYDYEKSASPISLKIPSDIEVVLDNIPIKHPFVPRICAQQGYLFIWFGTKETDPDLYEDSQDNKLDSQWATLTNNENIEKGVALFHIYDDEVIIGSFKTAGYMGKRGKVEVRNFLRKMWTDTITMFGDKRIICPAGSMFEFLHLTMNQKRIPHEPYHRELMQQFGFKRVGDYWIR